MRTTLASFFVVLVAGLLHAPTSASAAAGDPFDRYRTTEGVARLATMKQRVVAITNNKRRAHGCRAVRWNNALTVAAQRHSNKMADRNRLSHRLAGEPSLGRRITRAGYRNWRLVAENIAWGDPSLGPRAIVREWMQSADHRKNILDCRLRDIGVGIARGHGKIWWTQDFGRKW